MHYYSQKSPEDRASARQRAVDALPEGACRLLLEVTTVQVRDPDTSTWGSVAFDERHAAAHVAVTTLLVNGVRTGLRDMRLPWLREIQHVEDCPLCAEHALPGPPVYGLYLSEDWHAAPGTQYLRQHTDRIERFASLARAQEQMHQWLAPVLGAGNTDTRHHDVRTVADYVETAPQLVRRSASRLSQLWLWDQDPRGNTRRQWPQTALAVRDGQIVVLTGRQLAALWASGEISSARAVLQNPVDPATRKTMWNSTVLGGIRVSWIWVGAERAVHAVIDPWSTEPARRVLTDGSVEPLGESTRGLTVYGRYAHERPSFAEFQRRHPEYAPLIAGIEAGRGTTQAG
jgi:hypothetical protein